MPDNLSSPSTTPFPLLSTRQVYRNPWIEVREDRVTRPGGREGIFGVITMKPGSSVLAITDDLQTFLTREYKYAIARESIEVASGAIDNNESPLDAAKRELKEELGITARQWIDAGHVDPFTTVVSSPNYMFIALDLHQAAPQPDDGEVLTTVKLPLARAIDMAMTGQITHAASCVLLLKARHILNDRGIRV